VRFPPSFPLWSRVSVITLASACAALGAESDGAVVAPLAARPSQAPAAADETVLLSPFEVMADARDTYDATNTNSITGTNTSLNKTPLDARVFNRTMMDELDVVDVAASVQPFRWLSDPKIRIQ
jgi:hypothetical protein